MSVDSLFYYGYNSIKVILKRNDIHDTNNPSVAEHQASPKAVCLSLGATENRENNLS
jgi:hypothetical protein